MILKEAVEIMKAHNEWRRGAETEMVNPKELGVAIDVLINHAEAGGKSAEEIKDNKIMLLEEDIWCVHKYFDDIKIPKSCKNGQQYSIVGRIKRLEERYLKQMSELESQYAHQQPVILKDRCEYEQLVEQYFGFKMTEKTLEINTDDHILTDFACHVHQHLHQPVQGYSREQMDEYGKNILKSISDTFLNPENLKKASLNDQAVIQAVGEKILDFPLPEIEQPVNDGWEGAHNIDDTEPPKQSV